MVRRAIHEGLDRPRQPALEGFRGVVVAGVVAYHALRLVLTRDGGDWGDSAGPWWWWMGVTRFGVDAFFVLAGAFVTTSWLARREDARSRWAAVVDFAARRARRILPAFWAVVVLVGVPLLLAGTIDGGDLALLLSTQHYVDQGLTGDVNLPLWSLTAEVQFSLLAPAIALAVRRGAGVPLVVAGVLLSVWWTGWEGRGDLPAGLLPGRIDQFLVGALVGHLAAKGTRSWAVRTVTATRAGAVVVALLLALGTLHGATFQNDDVDSVLEPWLHPLAGLLLGALVLRLLCGSAPPALAARGWRLLGLVSYSLYLTHYVVLDRGFDVLALRGPDGRPMPAVLLGTALLVVVSLAVSVALHALVEHRFARRPTPTPSNRGQQSVSTTDSYPRFAVRAVASSSAAAS